MFSLNSLLLFFFLIICVNSQQQLSQKEYDCIKTLLTNLGTISKLTPNVTTSKYDFCKADFFFQPMLYIGCDKNYISTLNLGQSNMSYVLGDDFLCYENMTSLSLSTVVLDSDILYSSLPQKTTRFDLIQENIQFLPLPPTVLYFSVTMKTQTFPTQIKFSIFSKADQVSIQTSSIIGIGSHLIYFENDLDGTFIWNPSYIKVVSLNVPSFKYINAYFQLVLLPGFDQSSWINITQCESLNTLSIQVYDEINFPSIEFSQIRAENLTRIEFERTLLLSPPSLIDLSLVGKSMKELIFKDTGRGFTFGGSLPFILPTNEKFEEFTLKNAYIETFDFSLFTNVKKLNLVDNVMSGSLPIFNRTINNKLTSIDISFNQITGTIDDSYCELDLIVSNNSMTGLIPSCFTCFFGLVNIDLESRFIGNSFSNLNQPSSPSIIIPNLRLVNIYNYSMYYVEYEYYIFGENIGGSWVNSNFLVTENGDRFDIKVIKPNKIISAITTIKPPPIVYLIYSNNPNYIFPLSTQDIPPRLEMVDWVLGSSSLIFDGSFFTFNQSIVNITIGNYNCIVSSTSFYQIYCTISSVVDPSLEDILSYITIGGLTTQFTLNPSGINVILNCSENYNDCNGNGYCLSDIGQCKCDSNHQGDDCSIPFKQCLNNCNNIGQCNNQTGICSCPITPYEWIGIDCSIPLHTISAVSPSDTNGGSASIYGWFGNNHTDPQVFIGNKQCIPIYNISESEIICKAPPGTGLKSVSVIQNSINVTSKDIYQYYSNDKQCPNHCTSTSNGICNTTTGYCNCIGRWSGYDCSLYSNPSGGGDNSGGLPGSNTTIDGNTGNTNITNQQTNYQILITKLIEIDFNGNQINEYLLLNKWSIISNISKTVYTFIQSIQNDKCNITYTIEEINKDRDVSFAGINFKLTSGSVKMTVSIENYQYSSNLNTLQLQMKSSVNEIQTNNENDCNDDQIEINSTPNQDNSLNYIAIKKDAKVLNGRFIDRIESDGISTFMQTVLVSKSNDSITVGMNLPHCTKKCLLDPDFSVLISPEFIDECDDNNRESWFLPVVIAVPVGGLAAIIAIVFIIYKKRFVEAPLKRKLQRFSSSAN
ncbi:hypothetical protein DDB_G0277431 [Dictyostelium discoideum AX4]|uniref:EGF-like domain-containing protein n=1 Tax=Dictyostelium discoideum TaxID=44689 RepID=Q8T2F8_DICDI|nr:hypothetical protein DDB_G0277431 [Dictyostelium discoideum AX4]EAL68678.1 hypothetical protein DDB_G0277431 [Dictyostelium discoideum AX4]|eukprot:XP_642634.1 hypothetical protein DDB_G0277431 [Dictyostelium discoideum AX4]